MKRYNPKDIEPKWQKIWEETGVYQARDDSGKPKSYILDYFPYPSGVAMHMGHVRNYSISDVVSRFERMQGKEVLHPMGWDSFGLPAENYAIQNNMTPREAIDHNTARFKEQFRLTGMSYDWSREIDSSDPGYYKWTQWFFIFLFKRGLAYRAKGLQNWCPKDQTVLANEQIVVKDDTKVCERCGTPVEKKELEQWFFKITEYADRLADDLDAINWPESIKTMQRNWIGRSRGAQITFEVAEHDERIEVFTTRHDTQFGVTFMVLAPEHPLVNKITASAQRSEVEEYVRQAANKTDLQRQQDEKDKTGIFTGAYAINPVNQAKVPIWIADYVLMGYGTGAIMGVPGHDLRDHEFATKYGLEIRKVYQTDTDTDFHTEGEVINSGQYNGQRTEVVREAILADMMAAGYAEEKINYRIRDWLISRQRYWGAPIPMIHCAKDGVVPVPEDQLPVELPPVETYKPNGDGRSSLARLDHWVKTSCPKCGGPAERETDTMDGFACSSWYFLRFADPHNDATAFDKTKAQYWLPVDKYIGGAEHAVMHLLYARFWTKVMFDAGLVSFDEPFVQLRNQGMLLAEDGQKISKRLGNYVAPEELVQQGYGADALRTTVLFLAPYDQDTPWSNQGLAGVFRFLHRVWTLTQEYLEAPKTKQPGLAANQSELETQLATLLHRTIKKVTNDLHDMSYNTAISALMEFVNGMYQVKTDLPFAVADPAWREALQNLLLMLAPFAPHITEELWQQLGQESTIHLASWPVWDEKLVISDMVTIVVQVNGKVRANLELPAGATEADVVAAARGDHNVMRYLSGEAKKTIFVPDRLINFVV